MAEPADPEDPPRARRARDGDGRPVLLGLGRVPLAQAIALTFIAPLIALFLAASFLEERIGSRSIGGSLIAFAGVLVIVLGQARADLGPDALLGSVAILVSALCYAINIVLMRHQALVAEPLEINFFQSLDGARPVAGDPPFLGFPDWPTDGGHVGRRRRRHVHRGRLLFSWAYARAEASYLAVTEYSGFLWAAALGWLVFSEAVSLYTAAARR